MCLGESTTAIGGNDSYPYQLEEILNQYNTGIRFSVINKGVPAVKTWGIVSQLEDNLNKYRPHIITTMMGVNDDGSHMPYEEIHATGIMSFIASFRVYKLVRLLWLHIVTKAKKKGHYWSKEILREAKQQSSSMPIIGLKNCYAEEIDINPTERELKKAIELNPQDYMAYIELAHYYKNEGYLSRIEELYKKALKLNPRNEIAYVELGWYYEHQSRYSQAEECYKKALELNPQNENTYVELGRFYIGQKNPVLAEKNYKKALELNPRNDTAYFDLGRFYAERGDYLQAQEAFQKAIELDPKNDRAYVELGGLYRYQKKFSQAQEAFQKALELNSQNDRTYGGLVVLYQEMGRYDLADKYSREINKLHLGFYNPITRNNYRKLKEILDQRGIKLVCIQYPMRSIESLKKMFTLEEQKDIIFIDNEKTFKEALRKTDYREYFVDMFAGDFGHCTSKGNRLLAENIANTILREYFNK
jgi:Tfp pilus assembly protein PilF